MEGERVREREGEKVACEIKEKTLEAPPVAEMEALATVEDS